ncbi:nuclear transport factor 2 family protein [Amycolatopsis sp.]|uniref:nuclear transport factor 2 family protein n=1 Tax=Amycolatopsis sp. TaxID=37632 RepID=UPI002D7FA0A9|nr:nuclear transport factor 2 family protein [Amycolatopsis sp.]HET6705424.1 nuclear transport factor 2 family protein [Amycolatopsis sp.]
MSLPNERNKDVDTATVQRLLDESELRKLVQALPRALDERDFDGYGALFTEDAVMEIGREVRRGRQAITDGPKRDLLKHYEATYHQLGQLYVDIDKDDATILAYIFAYHLPKASEPMTHEDAGGKYHVVARRTEDGWRIMRCRIEVVLTQGAPLSIDV